MQSEENKRILIQEVELYDHSAGPVMHLSPKSWMSRASVKSWKSAEIIKQELSSWGLLYMLIGAVSMACMAIVNKVIFMYTSFTVTQVVLFRSLTCAACSFLFAPHEGVDLLAVPKN